MPKEKAQSNRSNIPASTPSLKKENQKKSKPLRHILSKDWEEEDIPYRELEREEELVIGL